MQQTSDHKFRSGRSFFARASKILAGAVLAISLVVPFGGCGATDCTTGYRPPLNIKVVNGDGENVTNERNLQIEYRISGHPVYDVWTECTFDETDLGEQNDRVRCGPDESGQYSVRATLGEASGEASGIDVNMDADGCHANTRNVDIVVE